MLKLYKKVSHDTSFLILILKNKQNESNLNTIITVELIILEPKELAKLALELIQDNRKEEILSLIIDPFTEEKEKLQALINVQIQMKEIGGGFPPVGKQIRTISEIINFTEVATKYSLEKG
ncbi:unnamed protein product, partial [marine sediment metagenome]